MADLVTAEPIVDPRPRSSRAPQRAGLFGFVLLAYVPLMLTDVGKIDADSKAYFYLDPSRLLAGAPSLWDPKIGLGTVAYQMLGFLFPIGPFYWITERLLGLPPWVAQRLWLGTLILVAGLGMRYLLRAIGVRGPGVAVGMLAFAFTPYAIQFSSQQSVLLPPWAGMPWMTAFVVLGLRRGGWKYPALLAITVQLCGSVNASALAFALLAPALWIPYAVVLAREVNWRRAWDVVWRSGLLITLTSLWWAAALFVESSYGRNILRFTEQPSTTSGTLYPVEVLRGLGYWIFYYRDGSGPVSGAASTFMRNPVVLFVSILIPALALLAATTVRWTYRAYFILLVVVGVVLAVGSSPLGDSSPFGAAFRSFSATSTAGFALRNSARAVPLIALGLAALLAAGVSSIHYRLDQRGYKRVGLVVVVVVVVFCLVDATGVWGRNYYDTALEWRSIPAYWHQAAASLDAKSHDSRVLALPGSPFAAYTWGTTQDPVEPALMNRPFATIEQIPEGSDPAANLLAAIDVPLQAGDLDPDALAPVARLMGAGDVLLDMDLLAGRYGLVDPAALWDLVTTRPPAGLATPERFGTPSSGPPSLAAGSLARPPLELPPPLAVYPVEQPLNIVRTKPAADPLVVDGDGDGLVGAASAGLLDARRLVLYSASFEHQPSVLRALPAGASLVVTDSNRKRPYWATSLTNSYGPTEQVDEKPLVKSPYDQRLDVFPGATSRAQTVTIMRGAKSVRATSGYSVFNPSDTRPSLVLDGNVFTGWVIDEGAKVGRERLRIELAKPITTDQINVVQPLRDPGQARWISRVGLRFDDGRVVHRALGEPSRTVFGETVTFPKQTFKTVELTIERVHQTKGAPQNAVGFDEIRVADDVPFAKPVGVQEIARMPLDLLQALGSKSLDHALSFVVSRDAMDDAAMRRQIWLPTARSFSVSGTARLGANASDAQLDHLLGIADASAGGVAATSIARYGDVIARASSAIDGDPTTAWTTPLGKGAGTMELSTPQATTFDHLDLRLVNDGRHSIPTRLSIQSDSGATRDVDLTQPSDVRNPDGTISVPATFEAISGREFTFTITGFAPVVVKTPDGKTSLVLPSGIAELGVPGVQRAPLPERLPGRCLDDLVTIDGRPFPVRVSGTTADALAGRPLQIQPCDPTSLALAGGTHEIAAAESPNSPSGADVEHLVLASDPGGAATAPGATASDLPPEAAPAIRVVRETRTSMTLQADAASDPYWLVLGQSLNRGWAAKADGHDLGEPVLVDGFANGWRVQPTAGKPTTITLEWTPQRHIRLSLLISALALLSCLGIAVTAFVRDRRRRDRVVVASAPPSLPRGWLPRPLDRRRGAIIGTVATVTIAGSLLIKPWVGPVVGVIALLAILDRRWHLVLRLAPAALVVGTAVYVVVAQLSQNYPAVFQWPKNFDAARIPIWAAIVLLGADALIASVWRTDVDDQATPD